MSLKKRGSVWVANLVDLTGKRIRQSLFTTNKDVARLLHNECEQRILKGEELSSGVVRGLLQTAIAPSAAVISQVIPFTPQRAVESRQRAGITVKQAYLLAKVEHDKWRESTDGKTIEKNYRAVAEYWGDNRPLAEITTTDIATWRRSMIEKKRANSTTNQRMSFLSVLFTVAEDAGHPVEKPRFKRLKPALGRTRYLSQSEEMAVITWFKHAASGDAWSAAMLDLVPCLIDTGFRISELLSVREATHIDWDDRRLFARRTKSGKDRAVPMTQRVYEILRRRCRAAGLSPWEPLVVYDSDSTPERAVERGRDMADDRWAVMRESLGFDGDKEFVLHALRHTCATRLALKGMDAFRIMEWMGHANISTTMIYVNLAGAGLKGLRDALDGFTTTEVEHV